MQKIDPLGAELYLRVRNDRVEELSIDDERVDDPDDLWAVISGARVRL